MNFETIIYEKEAGIAILTFNRPHVMNASDDQMSEEVRSAVEEAGNDDEVKTLIVTGAGRGFHAGEDVGRSFLAGDREKRQAARKLARLKGTERAYYLEGFLKPTIAAVNGPAVGFGCDLAVSCDIRLASDKARFGYFYVRRGLVGNTSGIMTLTHLLGPSRALEIMLSGELIDAAEADRIGLVSRVVPGEKLLEEARQLAGKFTKAAPLAQLVIKRAVHKAMFDPAGLAEFLVPLQQMLSESEDHLEGAMAFAEKRDPDYKGR